MGYFTEAVEAELRGESPVHAYLAHFDFKDVPMRLHEAFGTVRAGGYDWQGIGGMGRMSDLERSINGKAPVAVFGLSGVSPQLIQASMQSASDVSGRTVRVFLQFFDRATLRPLDDLVLVYRGVMDRMTVKRPSVGTCSLQLTAETRYALRGTPPGGWLSDRDQQRRFPGDAAFKDMAAMASRSRPWSPAKD